MSIINNGIRKAAQFVFAPFSIKQKKILTWWLPPDYNSEGQKINNSPHHDKDVFICDGAVRSGKTIIMSLSFVNWAMATYNYTKLGMAGKTIGSFRRNVLFTLKIILRLRGYKVKEHRTESYITISRKGIENYFYIFGGKDERSQDLVQGFTSGGFFFDEVALMPESFVNQAVARCSLEHRKLWFNCNPDGPFHWFKIEWIDKIREKNGYRLQFLLDDNPSLSEKTKDFYKRMFHGVFYKRFILGLWVVAEGVIYDMFNEDNEYIDGSPEGPNYNFYYRRYYSMDYGTINPFVCLEVIEQNGIYYQENEYYYNSKRADGTTIQKEDSEYADDIVKFIGDKQYVCGIVDPSAASFKVAARNKGLRLRDANNDVYEGIMLTASLFKLKRYKVNKTNCPNTIKERASYVWNNDKALKTGKEEPLKQHDHAMDAIRYFCKTIIKQIRGGWK